MNLFLFFYSFFTPSLFACKKAVSDKKIIDLFCMMLFTYPFILNYDVHLTKMFAHFWTAPFSSSSHFSLFRNMIKVEPVIYFLWSRKCHTHSFLQTYEMWTLAKGTNSPLKMSNFRSSVHSLLSPSECNLQAPSISTF